MIPPPVWTSDELEVERNRSVELFKRERLEEPLELYLERFDEYQGLVEQLLETTVDLSALDDTALDILTDKKLIEVFRYLPGPPISADDLKVLTDATSLNRNRLREDPALIERIVSVVLTGLDRRRFPWVIDKREPTEAERSAAVLASSALLATQRVGTHRRSKGSTEQEGQVQASLIAAEFTLVSTRTIRALEEAPQFGEFCPESLLGKRKADFVVRLWDRRVMPVECKVSNSSTNSVKRLNNDAAVKAEHWRQDFGKTQVVPAAVLSGVYKLHNLEDAQHRGLALFWAHDLHAMLDWIDATK